MRVRNSPQHGFTIVEILAVWMIIGVLVGLLLPAIQASRERARQVSCSNNLLQVGLAITAYHSAFNQLPVHMHGTDGSSVKDEDNDQRLSFLVALMPFLGHDSIADDLKVPVVFDVNNGATYGAMYDSMQDDYAMESFAETESEENAQQKYWPIGGPAPTVGFPAWLYEVPEYRCPSDPGVGMPSMGRTNYAACLGDSIVAMDTGPLKDVKGTFQWDKELAAQTAAAMRGVFVPRSPTRFRDVTDGLSATMMCGEIATGLGDRDRRTDAVAGPGEVVLRDNPNWAYQSEHLDPERTMFWLSTAPLMSAVNQNIERGYRWADGAPLFTVFNTILPPNDAITLSSNREDASGVLPPSSRHQGGVGVCFADGSVRFITDSIDAGNRYAPTTYVGSANPPGRESVYGVWGAMGTRASAELVWPTAD